MNPIVVSLADGHAFFLGMGFVIVNLLTKVWMRSSVISTIMRICSIIGVTLVLASATPFPLWIYGLWLFLWLLTFILPAIRTQKAILPSYIVFSLLLCLIDLDILLQQLSSRNQCVMFELPLLPFHNGYGEAQRRLARKYKVTLIPKDCLAGVIAKSDDTIDGLHLSQKGHDVLAAAVFGMFQVQH